MAMMQTCKQLMINLSTFTSHLPPFPFAFELAVAFFQSSNQTNNRCSHPRYHRPTDGADMRSSARPQQ